jgi:hypothetical protein
MLRQLDEDLWVADIPLKLMGCQFGSRASVVRLSDGGLWIHSPVPLGGGLRAELEALGPVRHIVAPNKVHYFYVEENMVAFPEAQLHLAPGLAEKRPELPAGHVLGESSPWSADLDEAFAPGASFLNETVFLHRRSRTLILTDLAFNLREPRPAFERIVLRILGAYNHFGPSRIARMAMRDHKALRAFTDTLLEWDFERIVLAHGDIVDKGGREIVREAYAYL